MSNIICETRGHVLLIGLNRPEKRNALTPDMYYDMALAWGNWIAIPSYAAVCSMQWEIILRPAWTCLYGRIFSKPVPAKG